MGFLCLTTTTAQLNVPLLLTESYGSEYGMEHISSNNISLYIIITMFWLILFVRVLRKIRHMVREGLPKPNVSIKKKESN